MSSCITFVSLSVLLCEMEITPTLQGCGGIEIMARKRLAQCPAHQKHDAFYLLGPELLFALMLSAPLYL